MIYEKSIFLSPLCILREYIQIVPTTMNKGTIMPAGSWYLNTLATTHDTHTKTPTNLLLNCLNVMCNLFRTLMCHNIYPMIPLLEFLVIHLL